MSQIKAAIFDLDGLLLDTEGMFDQMVQEYAVKMIGKELPFDTFKQLRTSQFGRPKEVSAKLLHDTLALSDEIPPEHYLEWRKPREQELFTTTKLLPGAAKVIKFFHDRHLPMAIATSSTKHDFQLKTSRHCDLFSLFGSHIITNEQVTKPKPNPEIFYMAAKLLGVETANCVVFEDANSGITAAKAAKMFVVAVPHPWLGPESVARADVILKSLDELDPPIHLGLKHNAMRYS